jgi:hypothetical protein
MKKLAILILASVLSFAAAAGTAQDATSVDVSKLTAAQKAEALKYVASLEATKPDVQGISEKTREEVGKWGELGVGMGRAAVAAAREVGVAANEFVQTPLGKVTMAVVAYKVIGKDIIKFFVGGAILVTFTIAALACAFGMRGRKGVVTYESKPILWGAFNRQYITSYRPDGDLVGGYFVASIVCVLIAFIVGLNVMF